LLVTGPTGSGKSTTLYSALTEINSPELNILTIEDPVEYEAPGIGQVQVNPKINLTFASALRAFLRQDPDVILVGEIRDAETAGNAVQASLTGHLVFSTLHTNDSASSFARICDMEVENFLVADTVLGILAQRLVRGLCPHCKDQGEYVPTEADLVDIGLNEKQLELARGKSVIRAVGCEECGGLGYAGRTGIYEFLTNSDEIQRLVIQNAPSSQIKKVAEEQGMDTLFDDGLRKVLAHQTTFEEVKRVTTASEH
jgi:general secretion pathway protein E